MNIYLPFSSRVGAASADEFSKCLQFHLIDQALTPPTPVTKLIRKARSGESLGTDFGAVD
jgi:hypothetical protein